MQQKSENESTKKYFVFAKNLNKNATTLLMQNAPKYRQFEHIFDVQGTCRWCRNLKPGANECWDVQHSYVPGPGPAHDQTAPRSTKMKKNCFNYPSYLDSLLKLNFKTESMYELQLGGFSHFCTTFLLIATNQH